jgi:hypothetical protein
LIGLPDEIQFIFGLSLSDTVQLARWKATLLVTVWLDEESLVVWV